MEDFIFREGTAKDKNQLHQLGIISYGLYKDVLPTEGWEKLHTNLQNGGWMDLLNTAKCFVCEVNEKIVGMAFIIPHGNPWDIFEAEWAYIRMVGVNPEYVGKGIAKKLTQLCIDHAKQKGETIIALHTSEFMDAARHIYEKLGFKKLHEIEPRFGKRYWLYTLEL